MMNLFVCHKGWSGYISLAGFYDEHILGLVGGAQSLLV